jgi:hypothetical protein
MQFMQEETHFPTLDKKNATPPIAFTTTATEKNSFSAMNQYPLPPLPKIKTKQHQKERCQNTLNIEEAAPPAIGIRESTPLSLDSSILRQVASLTLSHDDSLKKLGMNMSTLASTLLTILGRLEQLSAKTDNSLYHLDSLIRSYHHIETIHHHAAPAPAPKRRRTTTANADANAKAVPPPSSDDVTHEEGALMVLNDFLHLKKE